MKKSGAETIVASIAGVFTTQSCGHDFNCFLLGNRSGGPIIEVPDFLTLFPWPITISIGSDDFAL
jgi:hypothetical protein